LLQPPVPLMLLPPAPPRVPRLPLAPAMPVPPPVTPAVPVGLCAPPLPAAVPDGRELPQAARPAIIRRREPKTRGLVCLFIAVPPPLRRVASSFCPCRCDDGRYPARLLRSGASAAGAAVRHRDPVHLRHPALRDRRGHPPILGGQHLRGARA